MEVVVDSLELVLGPSVVFMLNKFVVYVGPAKVCCVAFCNKRSEGVGC
jgi:hypothetical protein